MKRKLRVTLLLIVVLFGLCGCGNEDTDNNYANIQDVENLKSQLNDYEKELNNLTKKNSDLEKSVSSLKTNNKSITKNINNLQTDVKDLKNNDKVIQNDIANLQTKTNELEKNDKTLTAKVQEMISKMDNYSNKNTISKAELIGSWQDLKNTQSPITFTEDNVEVIGNWIVYEDNMTVYYEYINNILYVTDNGYLLKKVS